MGMIVVVVFKSDHHPIRCTQIQLFPQPPSLEQRQTPSALCAFPLDVLSAHPAPEEVVVGEVFPELGYLSSLAERDGIEVSEDSKTDFSREECEGIHADDLR
jgi:hypothetical protein